MECIYLPDLNVNEKKYQIFDAEAHHLKVLRIQSNDKILIISGKGLSAIATINRTSKNDFSANIVEFFHNKGELNFRIGLAIGILDNRERFEFAIEKSTELGVSDIFPLITDYSQQNKINRTRLITKTISAIKQSKRSTLPIIHNPTYIANLLFNNDFDRIILANENGITPEIKQKNNLNTLIFIGPEGGFSQSELNTFNANKNIITWSFGNRRLRAETAAITGISFLSLGF